MDTDGGHFDSYTFIVDLKRLLWSLHSATTGRAMLYIFVQKILKDIDGGHSM